MANKRKPVAESPAAQRLRITQNRRPSMGSALAFLQENFLPKESVEAFIKWRNDPTTMLMIESLRELALNPPAGYVDTEDLGVQYGVSTGLSLAGSFFGDPTVLYPFLFSGAAPGDAPVLPETDYSTGHGEGGFVNGEENKK